MKKQLLMATLGLLLMACGKDATNKNDNANETTNSTTQVEKSTETEAVQSIKPKGFIYKRDDYKAGDEFQYAQVWIDDKSSKILGLWLWTDDNPEKKQADIIQSEYSKINESSFIGKGEFNDPNTQIPYEFGVIYETFSINTDDGEQLDFFYETEKWD